MEVSTAIAARRSIRRFTDRPVAPELIERLLTAATLAPSGKNMQPWRFVVLEGERKDKLVDVMSAELTTVKAAGNPVGSAEHSAKVMRQAPVTILIYDSEFVPDEDHSGIARIMSLVHTQSIGAAIQNMLLAAEEAGLGTLWICDVFFAEAAINALLGRTDELVAAVSVGYAAEAPAARPRRPWSELTDWQR